MLSILAWEAVTVGYGSVAVMTGIGHDALVIDSIMWQKQISEIIMCIFYIILYELFQDGKTFGHNDLLRAWRSGRRLGAGTAVFAEKVVRRLWLYYCETTRS